MLQDDNHQPFVIEGSCTPFHGQGEVLPISSAAYVEFANSVGVATKRVVDTFRADLSGDFREIAGALDSIIGQMWEEGWNPHEGDPNLFITDFGLILADAMARCGVGELLLRSEYDPSFTSIWDRENRIEYFPFHIIAGAIFGNDKSALESVAN